jgi:hypothetical protein
MKQTAYLQLCRDEVRRSKKWRADEGYEDDWKRYIDLYQGKQYQTGSNNDQLIVNLIFSTINVMAPAVAVNNPRFVVNARRPDTAPQAVVTEEVLNYMWRTHRYQDEFRLAVLDWLITGHAWLKCGYKFTKPPVEKKVDSADVGDPDEGASYGIDDRDPVEGNVESEMYIYDDRPFLERISLYDMFVDPDSRNPKEMCWIAQRTWRPIQDVQVDERYSPSARKKVSAKSWSRWSSSEGDRDARDDAPDHGPKSFCEIIEFYDIKRRTVCTFALDAEDTSEESAFLIKPHDMPYAMGHPFEMLRNYEVSDHFYPIGDVCQIESLQLELNQTRTQMMNHRKRFQRKWVYERDAFDREGVQALEADVDNTMIPVLSDGDPARVIAPLPAVITPTDFYDQSGLITNDIDRVSGVSDYQRGSAQTTVKRTATEAAMIQDAANARAQDRLAKIESTLARLGERIIGLMQQYMTGEQVARIVTMPGKAWVNYDADYIQGEFDFDVAAGSTEPMNETFRRQSALQLVDASMPFLEMGVANPMTLYMHVLQKGFGIKDAGPFIMQQQPPQQPGMEQAGVPPEQQQGQPPPEGQMPPEQQGQQMPPEQGAPPMPPGMPPEMMQGPAPMPPEMMAMMQQGQMPPEMGMGGPPPQGMPPEMMDLTAPQGMDPMMEDIDPALLMQMMGSSAPY